MKQITVEFLTPITKTFTVSDKKAKIISILAKDEDEMEEIISDYLSDVTGYCHNGYVLED